MRLTWLAPLVLLTLPLLLAAAFQEDKPPAGLPAIVDSKTNPTTTEKVALGKKLFFDKGLSRDGTVSCASCHDPEKGYATNLAKAEGIEKKLGRRNAPSLYNRVFSTTQFWDGRAGSLEDQALLPISDPLEMDNKIEVVIEYLKKTEKYKEAWSKAFGNSEPNQKELALALAAFQRSLLLGDSPVDSFVAGDVAKLSAQAKHGLWIFESRGKCWQCHAGKNYTDESFRNTGVSWGKEPLDLGRFEISKKDEDKGRFKVPTLRGIAHTAPYMHDGSLKTLEEVVAFYNKGGNANPNLDKAMKPLELTKDEEADLVAFLKALSDVDLDGPSNSIKKPVQKPK